VFNRFILKAPLAWSEELATLFFQWVVFLGAAVGVKRLNHFGIDLLVKNLPGRIRRRLRFVSPLVTGVVALTLIIKGIELSVLSQDRLYATLGISHAWKTAAIPVSGFFMVLYIVQHAIRIWKEADEGQNQ